MPSCMNRCEGRRLESLRGEAVPPPEQQAGRGHPRSTAGGNLLKAHEEAVALVEGVPFTNNQAERALTESERVLSH